MTASDCFLGQEILFGLTSFLLLLIVITPSMPILNQECIPDHQVKCIEHMAAYEDVHSVGCGSQTALVYSRV